MTLPLITVIGSLNKDVVTRTSRVPSAGETLTATSFDTGNGGKGANQAVACARLSRRKDKMDLQYAAVQMIGAVGDDQFGRDLLESLNADGVDTQGIQKREHEKTGVAIVIVEEKTGENRILVCSNANSTLVPENFTRVSAPYPDLIILQLEIPIPTVLRIIEFAHEKGIEVLLNPAPAVELPDEIYKCVTHLVLNETEASMLSKTSGNLELQPTARRFLQLGVRNVVITLGSRGAFYSSSEAECSGTIGVGNVNAVDTTAAGDTFVGAYAVRVAKHKQDRSTFNLEEAVSWANKAASKTVESEGAQNSIPWLDEAFP
ncbi:hypothetical protein MMC07_003747 [Pseudocyphellaria aurata]|nr:hypothetical protein [Pseudocyphellaria aurata]